VVSFRTLELGVPDFHADETNTEDRLKLESRKAVEEDRAEVIVLGCTMQFGFFKKVQEAVGVPVIDAVLAPFKHAEMLVDLRNRFGWQPSKAGGYETPPIAEIKEWRLEEQYGIEGLWTITGGNSSNKSHNYDSF